MQEELQRNYDNVAAYVKNGIANQADLDAVKVEQLNNIQQRHIWKPPIVLTARC